MNSPITTNPAAAESLALGGTQDVRNVNELHRSVVEAMSNHQFLKIDCCQIQSLDAACLQVLLAAKRETSCQVHIIANPETESAIWIAYSGLTDQLLGTTPPSSAV